MSRTRRLIAQLTIAVASMFLLTGCLEALAELFVIELFEESDDPDLRTLGGALREVAAERGAAEALHDFRQTGDPAALARAENFRPEDSWVVAHQIVADTVAGRDTTDTKQEFISMVAYEEQTLARADRRYGGNGVELVALEELTRAQRGVLNRGSWWDRPVPPAPEEPPERHRLWADYCATQSRLLVIGSTSADLTGCPGS